MICQVALSGYIILRLVPVKYLWLVPVVRTCGLHLHSACGGICVPPVADVCGVFVACIRSVCVVLCLCQSSVIPVVYLCYSCGLPVLFLWSTCVTSAVHLPFLPDM